MRDIGNRIGSIVFSNVSNAFCPDISANSGSDAIPTKSEAVLMVVTAALLRAIGTVGVLLKVITWPFLFAVACGAMAVRGEKISDLTDKIADQFRPESESTSVEENSPAGGDQTVVESSQTESSNKAESFADSFFVKFALLFTLERGLSQAADKLTAQYEKTFPSDSADIKENEQPNSQEKSASELLNEPKSHYKTPNELLDDI